MRPRFTSLAMTNSLQDLHAYAERSNKKPAMLGNMRVSRRYRTCLYCDLVAILGPQSQTNPLIYI